MPLLRRAAPPPIPSLAHPTATPPPGPCSTCQPCPTPSTQAEHAARATAQALLGELQSQYNAAVGELGAERRHNAALVGRLQAIQVRESMGGR